MNPSATLSHSAELSYRAYQDRQQAEVTPAGLAARAAKVGAAGKFRRVGASWAPVPYVGHAVLSVLATAPENAPTVTTLGLAQDALVAGFARPDALYALPKESFHQTVANTLSDDRYQRHVVDKGLVAEYPKQVAGALAELPENGAASVPVMRMIGISIFGTALGVLGVFEEEAGFDRVIALRDRFYGSPEIAALGIRRTRPFIGHVTLAYVESELNATERERLVAVVSEINQDLAKQTVRFAMPVAELRSYEHLAEFRPMPWLPVYRF
ncbi:MAG: hypothetical protein RL376_564 [Verrucomicrobiota bacterium]|jgi:hypothetical protein